MFAWIIVVSSVAGLLTALATARLVYPYFERNPRPYVALAIAYLAMLAMVLLYKHGDFVWSRSLYYGGLFSFIFITVVLSGTAYYAWTTCISALIMATKRLLHRGQPRYGG